MKVTVTSSEKMEMGGGRFVAKVELQGEHGRVFLKYPLADDWMDLPEVGQKFVLVMRPDPAELVPFDPAELDDIPHVPMTQEELERLGPGPVPFEPGSGAIASAALREPFEPLLTDDDTQNTSSSDPEEDTLPETPDSLLP